MDVTIPLIATIALLPCHGGEDFLPRLFEPLGYRVTLTPYSSTQNFQSGARVPTSPQFWVRNRSTLCAVLFFILHSPRRDKAAHYMRWFSNLIVNLILVAGPVHALDVTGVVVERSGKPISGATVKLVGIGSDTTTQTGEFRIPIPNNRVGQRVNIVVAKDGWDLASDQTLTFIVPADPVSDAIRITLSKTQSFAASAEVDQPTVDFSVISESPEYDYTVTYSADRSGDKLRIQPEGPYLDLFRRGGPIIHGNDGLSFGIPGFIPGLTLPELDIKVTNNTTKTVFFNEAVFIVDSSQLDPSPLLLIGPMNQMKMSLHNVGWKRITDATIKYSLIRPEEPEDFTQAKKESLNVAEDEDGWISVDFSEVLARFGVDVATFLHHRPNSWPSPKAYGAFPEGKAKVLGEISYADPSDTSKRQSVRFLSMLEFGSRTKFPGGAGVPRTGQYDVKFDVDNRHYEHHVSLAQALKPQDFDHFSIRIAADKSSIHHFKLRLLYNSGLVIESPPVELRLFMPRGTESCLREQVKHNE
jgi:hypothetical protein